MPLRPRAGGTWPTEEMREREVASNKRPLRRRHAYSSRMTRREIPIVLTAALVFADATIVTLALPNVLVDLHTTVYGVAAVLAAYTGALGCTSLLARRVLQLGGHERTAVAALCLFAVASIVCAVSHGLGLLLAGRVVQGVAGALILTAAGMSLASRESNRTWVLIGVLSVAAGPVIGGALTQAFSWRAIFVAQAPVPVVAALLRRTWSREAPVAPPRARQPVRPLLVLGLVSDRKSV